MGNLFFLSPFWFILNQMWSFRGVWNYASIAFSITNDKSPDEKFIKTTRKKSPEGSDCPSLIAVIVPVVRGWDQAISTRSMWVVWGNVTVPPKEGACFLQKNTGDVHHTQRKGSSRHCVLGFSHSPEVLHKACRWSFWNPELPSVQFHLLFSPELEPPHEDNNNWKQPVCDCQFKDTGQKIMLSKFKRKTIPERNLPINTSHHSRAG